jgi:hypothetical protein
MGMLAQLHDQSWQRRGRRRHTDRMITIRSLVCMREADLRDR